MDFYNENKKETIGEEMKMLQLGIRLHDVNAAGSAEEKTMASRAKKAAQEGFSCVHLAYQKVMPGIRFDDAALNEGLACYTKRVFGREGLDVAVLGCYLNLAHPDPQELAGIKSRYYGHLRVASLMGCSVVGTETGAPNAQYKLDGNTHTQEALDTFIRNLADVVACAEHWGVSMAIEPVWNHIVYSADRAVEVLKAIRSPNLRIILDPVNLLSMENADDREDIFRDAFEKLQDHIAVVHIKDFVRRDGKLISVAAGTGEMHYENLLRMVKQSKPFVQATLENTSNENAVQARELIQRVYETV